MAAFHPRTRLDSFVEGALSPSARARVSAHLSGCPDCRREVGQRERILRAAASLGPAPGPVPERHAATAGGDESVPVLERRDGVAGWKVVLGFGAVGLLTSGVLMTAWIAGAPESGGPESGQTQLLSFVGGPSPVRGADGDRAPASGPSSGSVPAGTPEPADAGDGAASSAPAYRAPVGSILSAAAGISPDAAVRLTPSMVTDLRQAGWNVPTFHGLGLPDRSAGWQRGEGVAEVVVSLSDDGHTLEFHECRALQGAAPAPACPVGADGSDGADAAGSGAAPGASEALSAPGAGPAPGPLSWAGADVVPLPVGLDMRLSEHADGSWTATLATDQAGYSVDSDLPVENAPRVMSMVVISERSRVQGGTAPESPGDRLARGFERILPWTDLTEPQRR